MLISTSVPHHHHLHQSTSDFKLTLVVRVIQFMSMTLISYHLSELNPPWFDFWIIQNPSSQPEAKSHCTALVCTYDIVAQVITSQQYYAPLLGLADSTRMGILKYDVDTPNTLLTAPVLPPPPLGELTLIT